MVAAKAIKNSICNPHVYRPGRLPGRVLLPNMVTRELPGLRSGYPSALRMVLSLRGIFKANAGFVLMSTLSLISRDFDLSSAATDQSLTAKCSKLEAVVERFTTFQTERSDRARGR